MVHHLHRKSNTVSDITCLANPDLLPPNKTTTLKSGPEPNATAECLHRQVTLVGMITCTIKLYTHVAITVYTVIPNCIHNE